MKNKNAILAAVVLISAVGTSVASAFLAPQTTWIKATKLVAGVATATCSTIGLLCDTQVNGKNCEVKVNLSSGAIVSTIGYSVQTGNVCSIPRRTATDRTFTETSATVFTGVEAYTPN